jgi:hypothetical protein
MFANDQIKGIWTRVFSGQMFFSPVKEVSQATFFFSFFFWSSHFIYAPAREQVDCIPAVHSCRNQGMGKVIGEAKRVNSEKVQEKSV